MSKPKLKTQIFAAVLFFAALLQVSFGVGRVMSQRLLIDFSVYYEASKALLSGINPYTKMFGENIPFNYPPSSFLFFIPMTFLAPQIAQVILTIFSLLSLILAGLLLTPKINWAIRLIILSLMLQNFPTKFTLVMGQINLIVLLLLITSFKKDEENRQVSSGLLFGLAVVLKPIPLLVALYFLIRRKMTSLIVGLLLFFLTNLGVIYLFLEVKIYFSSILPNLMSISNNNPPVYDQSLQALFTRMAIQQSRELAILVGVILLVLAVIKYRKDHHDLKFFSLILAITTITNSFAWQHHFVFLIPGYIATILMLRKTKKLFPKILLSLSFSLFAFHFPDPLNILTSNPFILSHTLLGSLIIIWLLARIE